MLGPRRLKARITFDASEKPVTRGGIRSGGVPGGGAARPTPVTRAILWAVGRATQSVLFAPLARWRGPAPSGSLEYPPAGVNRPSAFAPNCPTQYAPSLAK